MLNIAILLAKSLVLFLFLEKKNRKIEPKQVANFFQQQSETTANLR